MIRWELVAEFAQYIIQVNDSNKLLIYQAIGGLEK